MRHRWLVTVIAAGALTVSACAGSDDDVGSVSDVAGQAGSTSEVAPTSAPETTSPPASSPSSEAPTTDASSDEWVAIAGAWCDEGAKVFQAGFPGPSVEEIDAWVQRWRTHFEANVLELPPDAPPVSGEFGEVDEMANAWSAQLDVVDAALVAGDVDGALVAADQFEDIVLQTAGAIAVAGGVCVIFEPGDVEAARLNVPVLGAWQVGTGFDSVWVARQFTNDVERLDPSTGDIVATIDVGSPAFKMQPADGRVWVRTADAFVAIDPSTNQVTATLAKSDVGPEANRSWAVDGALWVCDGERVHRYDPTSLAVVATIELGFPCGQVYAVDDLAVAWSYNEDAGESGTSMAALVDPGANAVVHTVSLPIDVLVPVVLDDVVYFPGHLNDGAVVVDRVSGAVSEAPSITREVFGSQPAFDGSSIYVPAKATDEVVVIDATTFEVDEVMATLGVNSLAFADDTLWIVNNISNFVQAVDRLE